MFTSKSYTLLKNIQHCKSNIIDLNWHGTHWWVLGLFRDSCEFLWTRLLPDVGGALSLWLLRIPLSNCLLVVCIMEPFSTAWPSSSSRWPHWANSFWDNSSLANFHRFYLTYQIVDVACCHCCPLSFPSDIATRMSKPISTSQNTSSVSWSGFLWPPLILDWNDVGKKTTVLAALDNSL